jgi:hypothetical protein
MNSKIILCLTLGLSWILSGCSHSRGLTCQLSVPSLITNGTFEVTLILKNESLKPIRVCTFCLRSEHAKRQKTDKVFKYDVRLSPNNVSEGDTPGLSLVVNSIKTLPPGGSIQLSPFYLFLDPQGTWQVTAHYEVLKTAPSYCGGSEAQGFETLDIWRGKIDGKPVTIKFSK